MKTSYETLIRRALHGNKYLDSGELHPQYNPQWGLAKGRYMNIARAYAKNKELFIETSKTENPVEFIATGIISGKSQYQFREGEEYLRFMHGYSNEEAREKSVVISRMSELLSKSEGLGATEANVNAQEAPFEVSQGRTGEINVIIQNPSYYAAKYLAGEISKEDFYWYVKQWKEASEPFKQQGYGKGD